MSSRANWLCSKGINLWYRDAYRSSDLQSNLNNYVKNLVTGMINHVLTGESNITTKDRITNIQKWVLNHFESLSLEDVLKLTVHLDKNNGGMNGINLINNLKETNKIDISGNGGNWNLWPEKDDNNENIISNRICNISEIRSKYIFGREPVEKLDTKLEEKRLEIAKYLRQYDNNFQFVENDPVNDENPNISYIRIDPIGREINIVDISGNNPIPKNQPWLQSHSPGLEHRLD